MNDTTETVPGAMARESGEAASTELTADLARKAATYAAENSIARVGDLVETTWSGWKKPRRVRIVAVGAHLITDWSKERGFFLDFDMTYVAHRIRKDGSSAEYVPESGICLKRLTTSDGRQWVDRAVVSRSATWFNHVALSWTLERVAPADRAAYRPANTGAAHV